MKYQTKLFNDKKYALNLFLLKYILIKSYLINKPRIHNLNTKKTKKTKADKDNRSKSWICKKAQKLKLKKHKCQNKTSKSKLVKHKSQN